MDSTRRLVLIRHAKAESPVARDIERVLTPSGRDDCRALGVWLSDLAIVPDGAYISAAARTCETWRCVADSAGWSLEAKVDGGLYSTDEYGVLELIHSTDEDLDTVVIVGHNPTMASLAQLLDDGQGPGSAELAMGTFATSAAAVFEVAGPWVSVEPMQARLVAFHVARAA